MSVTSFVKEAKFLIIFVVIINVSGLLFIYFIGPFLQKKQKQVISDIEVVAKLLGEFQRKEHRSPASMEELRDALLPMQQAEEISCPIRDPWGNIYLFFQNPEETIILSTGPNGSLDNPFIYNSARELKSVRISGKIYELLGNEDDRIFRVFAAEKK